MQKYLSAPCGMIPSEAGEYVKLADVEREYIPRPSGEEAREAIRLFGIAVAKVIPSDDAREEFQTAYDNLLRLMGGGVMDIDQAIEALLKWKDITYLDKTEDEEAQMVRAVLLSIARLAEVVEALKECVEALSVLSDGGAGPGCYAYHRGKKALAALGGE